MYQVLKKSWNKAKYLILFGLVITLLLLVTVVYKSDEKIIKKSELTENYIDSAEFKKYSKNFY